MRWGCQWINRWTKVYESQHQLFIELITPIFRAPLLLFLLKLLYPLAAGRVQAEVVMTEGRQDSGGSERGWWCGCPTLLMFPTLVSSSTWVIIPVNLFAQHISFLSLTLKPHYHLPLSHVLPIEGREEGKHGVFVGDFFIYSIPLCLVPGFKGQPCLFPPPHHLSAYLTAVSVSHSLIRGVKQQPLEGFRQLPFKDYPD